MSCHHPLKAYWRSRNRDAITFDINKSATRISFGLPCGRCIGCRMEYARQWGMRCVHEAKLWKSNVFVTLTYNDEFLPAGGTLCVRDTQLFMKRLRKSREPEKVRFFLAGEYGDENRRPHYHALLFNVEFKDAKLFGRNGRGEPLFTSDELSSLWSVDGRNMGHCSFGAVTFDSAVYCAKYALKRLSALNDESSEEQRAAFEARYVVTDGDGVSYERCREFAVMSRRPGIGAGYYEKFGAEVVAHDSVVVNGREVRPPRYYDGRSRDRCGDAFERNKRKRKRLAVLNNADNTSERLRVKERLAEIAAEKKERRL